MWLNIREDKMAGWHVMGSNLLAFTVFFFPSRLPVTGLSQQLCIADSSVDMGGIREIKSHLIGAPALEFLAGFRGMAPEVLNWLLYFFIATTANSLSANIQDVHMQLYVEEPRFTAVDLRCCRPRSQSHESRLYASRRWGSVYWDANGTKTAKCLCCSVV